MFVHELKCLLEKVRISEGWLYFHPTERSDKPRWHCYYDVIQVVFVIPLPYLGPYQINYAPPTALVQDQAWTCLIITLSEFIITDMAYT